MANHIIRLSSPTGGPVILFLKQLKNSDIVTSAVVINAGLGISRVRGFRPLNLFSWKQCKIGS